MISQCPILRSYATEFKGSFMGTGIKSPQRFIWRMYFLCVVKNLPSTTLLTSYGSLDLGIVANAMYSSNQIWNRKDWRPSILFGASSGRFHMYSEDATISKESHTHCCKDLNYIYNEMERNPNWGNWSTDLIFVVCNCILGLIKTPLL